jgi:hypothetical protein
VNEEAMFRVGPQRHRKKRRWSVVSCLVVHEFWNDVAFFVNVKLFRE